jgi:ATP-dependent RNA helicase DHX36
MSALCGVSAGTRGVAPMAAHSSSRRVMTLALVRSSDGFTASLGAWRRARCVASGVRMMRAQSFMRVPGGLASWNVSKSFSGAVGGSRALTMTAAAAGEGGKKKAPVGTGASKTASSGTKAKPKSKNWGRPKGGKGGGRGNGASGAKSAAGTGKASASANKRKPAAPKPVVVTHGENGREIMTRQKAKTLEGVPDAQNLKSVIHSASIKMLFKQRTTTTMDGPSHNATFITSVRTTVPEGVIAPIPNDAKVLDDGKVEFVNTGRAFGKKESQTLALTDLYSQFLEGGVDPRNPPDVRKIQLEREKDRQQAKKNRAQLILEMLGASRPQMTTSSKGRNFITEVSVFIDGGKKLVATGTAVSKAGSETEAVINSVGTPLAELMGKDRLDELNAIIDSSPANHVAMMSVSPLPDKAIDILVDAMGSPSEHDERMAALDEMQRKFEEKFAERQESKWRATGDGSPSKADQIVKAARVSRAAERVAEQNVTYAEEEAERLQRALNDEKSPQGVMKAIRDALPIKAIREDLISALRTEQVVVVSGGTGSGKSTQCPQYILEDAIASGQGPNTRIIVTQPRRIAAVSVAERVAAERDEPIGNSVGFAVRLHGTSPRGAANIEFVTTGVLLRRLMRDQSLDGISHVMIDEVHERDINTDFLLVLLRELITKRPDLRVVLMSATLDAESFSDYFAGQDSGKKVPLMSVPTKPRHPVEIYHLEDLLDETTPELDVEDESLLNEVKPERKEFPKSLKALAKELLMAQDRALHRELEEAEAEEIAAQQIERLAAAEDEQVEVEVSEDEDDEDDEDDMSDDNEDLAIEIEGAVGRRGMSPRQMRASSRVRALRRAVALRDARTGESSMRTGALTKRKGASSEKEVSEITVQLVAQVAKHVATVETDAGRKGSILCFLPGWDEIKAAMAVLEETSDPELFQKIKVIPLHSTIPQEEQQKVFIPAPDGVVKVIFATNIAESSVTINDVLAVIDSGLVREMSWNAESGMSMMGTVCTSRASATQRTGRAGRVAPGSCYRIYSHGTLHAMAERPTPEIQRTALEATCLQTCSMTTAGVQKFLSKAMDPPAEETVAHAMDRLFKLGAIKTDTTSGGEFLTPMGRLLSILPLDPGTGRMLIMGAVMKCLDPVLTAAACFSSRDPFYVPPGMRDEAREIRQSFCNTSDLLATVRAYDEFQRVVYEEGWDSARRWASDNFVSVVALNTISSVRSQLLHELSRIGLVPDHDLEGYSSSKKTLRFDATVNHNSGNDSLFAAVWAAGLPGNIAARRQIGNFGTLRTRMEEHAGLHPSSVAFHRKPPRDRTPLPRWFLYREMMLSSQVFLRDVTAMRPEQLMLFGGHELAKRNFMGVDASDANASSELLDEAGEPIKPPENRRTMLDDWVVIDSSCADTMDLLTDVRREIDAALAFKVMAPRKPLPEASDAIVDAVSGVFRILDERDAHRERQFRRRDSLHADRADRGGGFRGARRT